MTLRRALLLIAANMVLIGGGIRVATFFVPDPEQPFLPSVALWSMLALTTLVGVAGLVWWGSVRTVGSWRALGWHLDQLPRRIAVGVLGGVAGIISVLILFSIAGGTFAEARTLMLDVSASQRLVFVGIGLQASIVEESLFRGNLQPLLQRRVGMAGGLVLTALIFAAYHLTPHVIGLAGKAVVGLVYGAVRAKDGSLLSSALAHALVWFVAGII